MNIHKESITIQVKKWIDDLLCSLSQPIYASEWREEYYKIISHLKQNEIKTFTLYQLGYNAFICESFGKFKKDFDQFLSHDDVSFYDSIDLPFSQMKAFTQTINSDSYFKGSTIKLQPFMEHGSNLDIGTFNNSHTACIIGTDKFFINITVTVGKKFKFNHIHKSNICSIQ